MGRDFFHIIRWKNLVMVALIQGIIYTQLLITGQSVLNWIDFIFLSLITMLIAASGYVINDYYDTGIDQINQPARWIAGNTWSLERVKRVYFILIIAGGLLSILVAIRLGLMFYLLIYPLAIFALWFYSFSLKCKPIAGNLLVAFFCAGVVLIIAVPDWVEANDEAVKNEIWFYALFAFLTTWFREIVKDLEDANGDSKLNCQTFVVRYGMYAGKISAVVVGIFLLGMLLKWDAGATDTTIKLVLLSLQGAMVGSLALIWWAKDHTYFHHASTIVKIMMIAGTLLLFLI